MAENDKGAPLISVAMGTYNGAKYIQRAIKSIQNQTYRNWELIICDDASIDDTVSIIQKMAKEDPRIILLRNEKNSGLNISLNKCIQNSKGKYIARMDDDDISFPERFERQVYFLEHHPEYALVGCKKRFFDENGIWAEGKCNETPNKIDVFRSRAFSHPTVMMRKSALEAVGLYSTDKLNRRSQDYDLWCKLYFNNYKGFNIDEFLFDYYESSSSVKRRKAKYRIDHIRKQFKWRKKLNLPYNYDLYPLVDLLKCIVPSFIYLQIRKRKFK